MAFFWLVVNQGGFMDKLVKLHYESIMLYHSNEVQKCPWGPIFPILCHNLFIFKPKLNPEHPIQIQTQAYI